jgi:hypothetical protein
VAEHSLISITILHPGQSETVDGARRKLSSVLYFMARLSPMLLVQSFGPTGLLPKLVCALLD